MYVISRYTSIPQGESTLAILEGVMRQVEMGEYQGGGGEYSDLPGPP